MHLLADAVTYEGAHHAKPMLLNIRLDGMTDVGYPASLTCELDSLKKTLSGYRNELLCLGRDLPAGIGGGAVTNESSPRCAHIDRHDVAFLQDPFSGNPVDDHFVDGDAGAGGESSEPEKGRNGSLRHDKIVNCSVDLSSGDAGPYHIACQGTRCRGNFTGLAHHFELALILD